MNSFKTLAWKIRRRIVDRTVWRYGKAKRAYFRHIWSRVDTHRDPSTGMLYQTCFGQKVFLKSRRDYLNPAVLDWLCRDIYYKFYVPSGADVVVDIGAGYGHEACFLVSRDRGVRYFGVEIQPSVYESLCNTFRAMPDQCRAIGIGVSADTDRLYINSADNYTTASTVQAGYIEVPAVPWAELLARYGIGHIDLLKVNIEGAERFLLPAIGSMQNIKRVIISAHDFRADEGEDERFRTREFVRNYLTAQGYRVRSLNDGDRWLRNWLYGDRPD